MRIAIPSNNPGGLEAQLSQHFGHCNVFTIVDVSQEKEELEVSVLPNMPHGQGGCMAPVMFLKNQGVEALVAGGMGMRPLSGFQQVGITVFFNEGAEKVGEAVALVLEGKARVFGAAQTCGGGGGGCH